MVTQSDSEGNQEKNEVNRGSIVSELPTENLPISTVTSMGGLQMESSMCEDQEDSFMDKNSIAEFELLEKECFTEDTAHTQKSAGTGTVKGTKAKK